MVSSLLAFLQILIVLPLRSQAFSSPSPVNRFCSPAEATMSRPTIFTSLKSITIIHSSKLFAASGSNNGSDGEGGMQFERPDPEILLSARDNTTQQLGIAAIAAGLTAGTSISVQILNSLERILPAAMYEPFYTVLPVVIGTTIIAAGIAHFAIEDTFTAWVPPPGTWGGLWQVPAPGAKMFGVTYAQYHNRWTGLAEIGGGFLLILGRFGVIGLSLSSTTTDNPSVADGLHIPAALMFLLIAAVTPANTYMFTHDPDIPRIPPLPYPWGHAARGAVQCLLLAVCWKWATTGP